MTLKRMDPEVPTRWSSCLDSFTGTAGYSSLAEHYASHGFIVLAPEHSEHLTKSSATLKASSTVRPTSPRRSTLPKS
ncbi:MAG: hypothetical protein R2849_18000 [Thermomicrobiales bacterium]